LREPKLSERVARLEQDVKWIKNMLNDFEERLKQIEKREWYILSGVIISILLQILIRLMG